MAAAKVVHQSTLAAGQASAAARGQESIGRAAGLLPNHIRDEDRPLPRGERTCFQARHLRSEAGGLIFGGAGCWSSDNSTSPPVGSRTNVPGLTTSRKSAGHTLRKANSPGMNSVIFGEDPPLRPTVGNRAHLSRAYRHTTSTADSIVFGHSCAAPAAEAAAAPASTAMAVDGATAAESHAAAGATTPRAVGAVDDPIFGQPIPKRPTVGDRAHLSRAYRHTASNADTFVYGGPVPAVPSSDEAGGMHPAGKPQLNSARAAGECTGGARRPGFGFVSQSAAMVVGDGGASMAPGVNALHKVGSGSSPAAAGYPSAWAAANTASAAAADDAHGGASIAETADAVPPPPPPCPAYPTYEVAGPTAPSFLDDVLPRYGRPEPSAPQTQTHLLGTAFAVAATSERAANSAAPRIAWADGTAEHARIGGLPAQGTGTPHQPTGTVHAEIFDDAITHRGARLANGTAKAMQASRFSPSTHALSLHTCSLPTHLGIPKADVRNPPLSASDVGARRRLSRRTRLQQPDGQSVRRERDGEGLEHHPHPHPGAYS